MAQGNIPRHLICWQQRYMRLLIFLILLVPVCHLRGREFSAAYTVAAAEAEELGDLELAEQLINSGADPNGISAEGHTLLVYASFGWEWDRTKDAIERKLRHVGFLISKGANVNAADSLGIVPLLAADRRGSRELVDLLKSRGAKDLDWNDIRVKAAATHMDGHNLLWVLSPLTIENASRFNQKVISYQEVEKYAVGLRMKVVLAKGKDVFGRPFVLSTMHGDSVAVDPETIADLSKGNVIKPGYWKCLESSTSW